MNSCGTCRYYDKINSECHRFPPQVHNPWPSTIGSSERFPYVRPSDDWCGEYRMDEANE